jgi:hypothetical protein
MSKYKLYKTTDLLYPNLYNTDNNISFLNEFKKSYSDSDNKENFSTPINNENPLYWGPKLWTVIHIGSLHYPENASPIYIEGMKNFILGLPYILPCDNCKNHSLDFLSQYNDKLNIICSGRESLFKFFVDFHNYANKSQNKKIFSYEEAKQLYS